MKSGSVAASVY